MQIFKDTNYDFLGKKWFFINASLVLTLAGLVSLYMKGGPQLGIDFRGGAVMYVKFAQKPHVEKIRSALAAKISGEITVQEITTGDNEVMIGTELKDEKALNV